MSKEIWGCFNNLVGSSQQMSANMQCELKSCLEVIIVTLGQRIIKGVGQMRHKFKKPKTGIVWFSEVFTFSLHCRNFYSLPCTSIFHFVSIHLSLLCPNQITSGGHHVWRVWEDDIISVNFILSLPCCQWTLHPVNSSFRGPSPPSSVTFHFFSVGFSHPKKCQKSSYVFVWPTWLVFVVLDLSLN